MSRDISTVEEEHGIMTSNGQMFSLSHFHFQFEFVNISTILNSKLRRMHSTRMRTKCVSGRLGVYTQIHTPVHPHLHTPCPHPHPHTPNPSACWDTPPCEQTNTSKNITFASQLVEMCVYIWRLVSWLLFRIYISWVESGIPKQIRLICALFLHRDQEHCLSSWDFNLTQYFFNAFQCFLNGFNIVFYRFHSFLNTTSFIVALRLLFDSDVLPVFSSDLLQLQGTQSQVPSLGGGELSHLVLSVTHEAVYVDRPIRMITTFLTSLWILRCRRVPTVFTLCTATTTHEDEGEQLDFDQAAPNPQRLFHLRR